METIDDFFEEVSFLNNYNQIAFKFFICYSRFEYALKCTDAFSHVDGKNILKASNSDFAKSINDNVLNDKNIADHVNFVFTNPPNQLYLLKGSRKWLPITPQPTNPTVEYIMRCMQVARNNIFHGNKQFPENDGNRNMLLIQSFLVILNSVINSNEDVKGYFLESLG